MHDSRIPSLVTRLFLSRGKDVDKQGHVEAHDKAEGGRWRSRACSQQERADELLQHRSRPHAIVGTHTLGKHLGGFGTVTGQNKRMRIKSL